MKPAILWVLLSMTLSAGAADDPLRVATRQGLVEGKRQDRVRAFLGIPFAAPPVGNLRWQPPMPPASWTGVRRATEFGPRPMQNPIYKDMIFRDPGPSEDCLTLNVWTPAKAADAKLPVMVWIFGGGFQAGGTSEQRQDGAHLAARGVVVVTMNYRLGIFGFLAHPDLVRESPHHAAGNYGLLDQLAALRWVHDNIAAFGGDAGNVTLFGESAGSASVSAQMASPLTKGLFHRAIGESGALGFSPGGLGQKSLNERATADADELSRTTGAKTLAELRALPAQKLLDAKPRGMGANVDGWFLPRTVAEIFAAGRQQDVPLLAGWNRDEQGLALPDSPPPQEALRKTAESDFGSRGAEFLQLYASDSPEHAARSGAEYRADRFIAYGTWAWLEAAGKTGRQPVYRYRFDRAPPADFFGKTNRGVYHSADILYVFGSFDAQPQVTWERTDREVSNLIQGYWTNFAHTGNPNGPGLPNWPQYSAAADWPLMHLAATPEVTSDDFRSRYLFLDAHLGRALSPGAAGR